MRMRMTKQYTMKEALKAGFSLVSRSVLPLMEQGSPNKKWMAIEDCVPEVEAASKQQVKQVRRKAVSDAGKVKDAEEPID